MEVLFRPLTKHDVYRFDYQNRAEASLARCAVPAIDSYQYCGEAAHVALSLI